MSQKSEFTKEQNDVFKLLFDIDIPGYVPPEPELTKADSIKLDLLPPVTEKSLAADRIKAGTGDRMDSLTTELLKIPTPKVPKDSLDVVEQELKISKMRKELKEPKDKAEAEERARRKEEREIRREIEYIAFRQLFPARYDENNNLVSPENEANLSSSQLYKYRRLTNNLIKDYEKGTPLHQLGLPIRNRKLKDIPGFLP